jgi:hypothetical protein
MEDWISTEKNLSASIPWTRECNARFCLLRKHAKFCLRNQEKETRRFKRWLVEPTTLLVTWPHRCCPARSLSSLCSGMAHGGSQVAIQIYDSHAADQLVRIPFFHAFAPALHHLLVACVHQLQGSGVWRHYSSGMVHVGNSAWGGSLSSLCSWQYSLVGNGLVGVSLFGHTN